MLENTTQCSPAFRAFYLPIGVLAGDGHAAQIDLRVLLHCRLGGYKAFLCLYGGLRLEAGEHGAGSSIKGSFVRAFSNDDQIVAGGAVQIRAVKAGGANGIQKGIGAHAHITADDAILFHQNGAGVEGFQGVDIFPFFDFYKDTHSASSLAMISFA